jgi:hypothetical protein
LQVAFEIRILHVLIVSLAWWAEGKSERAAQEGGTRPTHCN